MKNRINRFLDIVYALSKSGKDEYAVDAMFEYVNELTYREYYFSCDRILCELDLDRISFPVMTALLIATEQYKDKLDSRQDYFKKVKKRIDKEVKWCYANGRGLPLTKDKNLQWLMEY